MQTDRCDIFSIVTGSASWTEFTGGLKGTGGNKNKQLRVLCRVGGAIHLTECLIL